MGNRLISLLILAALLVAGLAILTPGVYRSDRVLMAADLLFFYSPWKELNPGRYEKAANWILLDEVLEFHPWLEKTRESFNKGFIPLWDSSAFCGYPFLAASQTTVLDPLERILDILPVHKVYMFRTLLHLGIAALGGALLIHMLGGSLLAGWMGGLAFAFSGFMVGWMGHPHSRTAAFLPLLLWGIEGAINEPGAKRTGLLGLVVSLHLFAGHLETALHSLVGVGIYAGIRLISISYRSRVAGGRSLLSIFSGLGIGIAGACSTLFPFSEYLLESSAYAVRSGGVVTETFFGSNLFLTILLPRLFGTTSLGTYIYPGFNSCELAGLVIGLPVIVLSITAFIVRPTGSRFGLFALALVGLMASFALWPFDQLFEIIPVFRMSYNFRFVVLTAVGGAVLAGLALGDLGSKKESLRTRTMIVGLIITGAVGGLILLGGYLYKFQFPAGIEAMADFQRSLSLLAALAGAIYLGARKGFFGSIGRILIIALTVFDLMSFGSSFNKTFPIEDLKPGLPGLSAISRRRDAPRTLGLSFTLPPHTGSLYGLRDIRGNDALTPNRIEELVAKVEPRILGPKLLPALRMLRLEKFNHPIIDLMAVGYVIPPPGSVLGQWDASCGDWPLIAPPPLRVYKNPNAGSWAFMTPEFILEPDDEKVLEIMGNRSIDFKSVVLVNERPGFEAHDGEHGRVDYISGRESGFSFNTESPGDQILVISETFMPGWKARVDGNPVHVFRTNYAFCGLTVPKGEHEIEVSYEPFSFRMGLFVSMLAFSVIIFLMIAGWGRFLDAPRGA